MSFSVGRRTAGGVLATAVAAALGLLLLAWGAELPVMLLGAVLLLIGMLVGLTMVQRALRDIQRELKALRAPHRAPEVSPRDMESLLRYTSAVEYRTRGLESWGKTLKVLRARTAAGTPAKTPAGGPAALASKAPEADDLLLRDGRGGSIRLSEFELHRPYSIPSTALKPQAGSSYGRHAAAVQRDARREATLQRLLTPPAEEQETRPLVCVVGNQSLRQHLGSCAVVLPMSPSAFRIPAQASALVIDEAELRGGVWATSTNSVSSRRYENLRKEIMAARKRGTAFYLVTRGSAAGNFGQDLRELSDLRLSNTGSESSLFGWADDVSTPFMSSLREFVRHQGEA